MKTLIKLIAVIVVSLALGCTTKHWEAFFEGLETGLEDGGSSGSDNAVPPAKTGSVSSSPGPVVQGGVQIPGSSCRVSPAGQKVCSTYGQLADIDLQILDNAWFITLNCAAKHSNYPITPSNIKPPKGKIIVVHTSMLSQACNKKKVNACYNPSTQNLVVSPDPTKFNSIYHEYGHHIDMILGNCRNSARHATKSFAVVCSVDPIGTWLNQADVIYSDIFGGEDHGISCL